MKFAMKNMIYMLIIAMTQNICFAGGLPPCVDRCASGVLQILLPAWQADAIEERIEKEKKQKEQIATQEPQEYKNNWGIVIDKPMTTYDNARYVAVSVFQTTKELFYREANSSTLVSFRFGNIYEKGYEETNKNSVMIDISLFNTYVRNWRDEYKESMVNINNNDSYRFSLSFCDSEIHIPGGGCYSSTWNRQH